MKILISLFIVPFLFSVSAIAKNKLLFIDPGFKNTVQVHELKKDGSVGAAITTVYPGDYLSSKDGMPKKIGKKEYFIINAKDESGKDIELAIETKSVGFDKNDPEKSSLFLAAPNARKTSVNGSTKTFGIQEAGMDRSGTCAISKSSGSDLCKEFSPKDGIEVEDAVLAYTTDGESPKMKWRNYVKDKSGYWLDSESTTGVDDSFSVTETKQAKDLCNDKYTTPEMASEADKIATEEQLDIVMKNIGECYDDKKVAAYVKSRKGKPKTEADKERNLKPYQEAIVDGVVSKKLQPLYKEMRIKDSETESHVDIVNATRADWASIDVLARTLYGEMASCFRKGDKYPQTVSKVVLNRVDCSKESSKCKGRFIDGEPDPGKYNDITLVAFKKYQFSIWNEEDKARRMAMCPPSRADKPFWNGDLPSEEEQKLWRDSVRFAINTVLKGETLRRKASDMMSLYYTSGMELPKKDFDAVTGASIAGQKLPLSRCIQVWNEKKLAESVKKYSHMFHPLFLRALTSVAVN